MPWPDVVDVDSHQIKTQGSVCESGCKNKLVIWWSGWEQTCAFAYCFLLGPKAETRALCAFCAFLRGSPLPFIALFIYHQWVWWAHMLWVIRFKTRSVAKRSRVNWSASQAAENSRLCCYNFALYSEGVRESRKQWNMHIVLVSFAIGIFIHCLNVRLIFSITLHHDSLPLGVVDKYVMEKKQI